MTKILSVPVGSGRKDAIPGVRRQHRPGHQVRRTVEVGVLRVPREPAALHHPGEGPARGAPGPSRLHEGAKDGQGGATADPDMQPQRRPSRNHAGE